MSVQSSMWYPFNPWSGDQVDMSANKIIKAFVTKIDISSLNEYCIDDQL